MLANRPVNSKRSESLFIKHGIPQGLIFGLVLYIIYINELPDFLKMIYIDFDNNDFAEQYIVVEGSTVTSRDKDDLIPLLYADDTTVITRANTLAKVTAKTI